MELNQKINDVFAGLVVRKDLAKEIKGNAIVPTYVLEYLLGQYCTTNDEESIRSGIETVKQILAKHYVHRNEAELVRSNIRERGHQKVIDKVSVQLNTKKDAYEATFANLGIKNVLVDTQTIKQHPKMLVSGIWSIADVSYSYTEDTTASPWNLVSIKPIQLSHFDKAAYLAGREQFTSEEWLDVLMQSIGFNPEHFSRRNKLLQLIRLIPFCERNYNLMELGPKGTGKSHIYSEFSPHGILISGGEVTVAKLFVNNSSGKIGLVGFWDTVAFDEFAGHEKKVDKALVDIMKNYMANKSFSRGVETLGAEASMVFVGNTQNTVPHMLKHADLFCDLPKEYHDSAYLDRIHFYIPGWEVGIIRSEIFSNGYGFVVDYLAEILRSFRDEDFSNRYQDYFDISTAISTRDRDGIKKTFSGLMKLLYPTGKATEAEVKEILEFAIEGRKRVKDQIMRFDRTFEPVDFSFTDKSGKKFEVKTLEEINYSTLYYKGNVKPVETKDETIIQTEMSVMESSETVKTGETPTTNTPTQTVTQSEDSAAKEGHLVFRENQRGVSFQKLFEPYLTRAKTITVTDPYIRMFYQQKNLLELLELVVRMNWPMNEVSVHLVTIQDDFKPEQQEANFEKMRDMTAEFGILFSWEYDANQSIHARHIVTDTGWKISLDRGLDIYQEFQNDAFGLGPRIPELRPCKAFEVTYIRQ